MQDAQPSTPDAVVSTADFSLRSSGRTYIERNREAEKIIDRIEKSSASVIGISGVRGAGKSSLAKKVLDHCSSVGYFTLLIPSPTGYNPSDFLLAVFQRIAEQVREIFEGLEDLAVLGEQTAIRLKRQMYAAAGIAVLLFSLLVGGSYYWVYAESQRLQAVLTARLEKKLQMTGVELAKRYSEQRPK